MFVVIKEVSLKLECMVYLKLTCVCEGVCVRGRVSLMVCVFH